MTQESTPPNRQQPPIALIPTGIGFLDESLAGGMIPGELHGIHSFTGGGATTLSCMIAAQGALAEWKATYPGPCKRRWCVVVTGQGIGDHWASIFSYLAQVPWNDAGEHWRAIDAMQTDELSAAVESAWRHGPADERARCILAHAVLQKAIIVIDGSSSIKNFYWTPTAILTQSVDRAVGPKTRIAGLVVDGLDFFVERYRRLTAQPEEAKSRLYRTFLAECRQTYGGQGGVPIWITHRLRGALAQSPPDTILSHHDVGECKHLGDELDACFVLGNKDDAGRFVLRCTKLHRASQSKPHVVRFDLDGIREIIEDKEGITSSSLARGWHPRSQVNIDKRTLVELRRLAAEIETNQKTEDGRDFRSISVGSDD